MDTIEVRTGKREELIDITAEIERIVARAGRRDGLCLVFVPHTTAGITINENSDPDVKADILMTLGRAVPDNLPFAHSEGNSTGHVKASLVGSSVTVPIDDGKLRLGTWQGITFCEFDGPRGRKVWVKIIG